MPTFNIFSEQNLGFCHSGGEVFAEGAGEVELTDEEVRQVVELIRENVGETDVEALDLEEKYPEIYEKLDDAYKDAAIDARYRELLIEGFENGYFEEPIDDLMKYCEDHLGFVFEYDEEDFRDQETGKIDEDSLEEEKSEYFWWTWLKDYFRSLSDDEKVSFVMSHFDCDDIVVDDYEYDVEIPEEILRMAKRETDDIDLSQWPCDDIHTYVNPNNKDIERLSSYDSEGNDNDEYAMADITGIIQEVTDKLYDLKDFLDTDDYVVNHKNKYQQIIHNVSYLIDRMDSIWTEEL